MSPRCKKPRHCRCSFRGRAFKPTGVPMPEVEQIALFRDELEAFKLCDLDGLTQQEAGAKMGVSRGTVQRILAAARRKAAMALSQGKGIVFQQCPQSPGRSRTKETGAETLGQGAKSEVLNYRDGAGDTIAS